MGRNYIAERTIVDPRERAIEKRHKKEATKKKGHPDFPVDRNC